MESNRKLRKVYKTGLTKHITMKATIINFRRSRHHQKMNQLILSMPQIDSIEKAKEFVGKDVTFKTQTEKEIKGKIRATHGNSGCVRALFERGIPGQALGQKLEVSNGNA